MPIFSTLELLPDDPILGITPLFNADKHPHKVNLGVGTYKDAEGNPFVFSAIKKAEEHILKQKLNKEYLPIDGDKEYNQETTKLIFGNSFNTIYTAQTIGGSGALRVGGDLLREMGVHTLYISDPSWSNHKGIFSRSGLTIETYPYYDFKNRTVNFDGMCEKIKKMPANSAILLHGCCHNPTGNDLSPEQWSTISALVKSKQIIPFIDLAYQGFKQGIDEDAFSVRLFLKEGHEMLVANSYAKNMGLYGERAGALSIVAKDAETIKIVSSHIRSIIRGNYSSPPLHAARLVKTVLMDPALRSEWLKELGDVRRRMHEMRIALADGLAAKGCGDEFSFLKEQVGMFSFIGLDPEHVQLLKEQNGLFMPSNGRINVAGLNPRNLQYVIEALLAVCTPK